MERPFRFGARHAGESKASALQGIEFARQLVALRLKPAGRSKWVYDVHGLVGVESDRALPELERFLVRSAPMAPSISVRVVCTADMPLGESVNLMRDVPTVSYRERTGFAMSLSVGPTIVEVTVSPPSPLPPRLVHERGRADPALASRRAGLRLGRRGLLRRRRGRLSRHGADRQGKTTTMLKVLDGSELPVHLGRPRDLVARWCRALLPEAADDQRAHSPCADEHDAHEARAPRPAPAEQDPQSGRPASRVPADPISTAGRQHQRPHPARDPAAQVPRAAARAGCRKRFVGERRGVVRDPAGRHRRAAPRSRGLTVDAALELR